MGSYVKSQSPKQLQVNIDVKETKADQRTEEIPITEGYCGFNDRRLVWFLWRFLFGELHFEDCNGLKSVCCK
ncbi:uncharacterized protein ASCRUDRAFT_83018 [Ascoidea rubescens DSM 1968]|uniref:Uncharacterized protein n=1 Tax=Ascoidea rubescens DSM 1968 TaxID=1344418 RepID=A0A1D2V8R4_9ASCO|nr:hypothetical protein ASCRUDRAFT_83018 [Ascoidea rubescens DSM 1968]ODV58014.1 hypothetical protein ASCRUDRAFT_83018 [Ascoidea rubescens DSM 1968]